MKTKRNVCVFLLIVIELSILLLYMFKINLKIGIPSESIFAVSFFIGLPIGFLTAYYDIKYIKNNK